MRALILCLWAGCASAPPPRPAEAAPIVVAVIELGGSAEAEDGCVRAVHEANHRAVDKQRLDAALPDDSDIDYQKLGHLLGADLIIDGGVPRGVKMQKYPAPRIVSTRKGDVLASSRVHKRANANYQTAHDVCADLLNQLP